MSKTCPCCKESINITNVFTFSDLKCAQCGESLTIDYIYRVSLTFSLLSLLIWSQYIPLMKDSQVLVVGTMLLTIVPFLIFSKRTLLIVGKQREAKSLVISVCFYLVALYLGFISIVST